MARVSRLLVGIAGTWLASCLAACTNVPLKNIEEDIVLPKVDDELVVKGSFCGSPAADVAYPVKVTFVVDGSGSQQFSDQNRQRVVAVEQTINALIGSPNVSFKVIVFNASISATPATTDPTVFTNDVSELVVALSNLAEADTVTDYQGALAVTYAELLRDMQGVFGDNTRGPAELARTKYVVIFISDGFPDPQCQLGLGNDFDPNFASGVNLLCENQDFLNCLMQVDDPVLGSTECGFFDGNGQEFCQFNDATCRPQADAATLFGGLNITELAAGADYNQPYQILQRVSDIIDLGNRFDVGEIRLHSGLVLDPDADPAVIAIFGDPTEAVPLMKEMANEGDGTYMEFYGGDDIDFLDINFDSLKQPRVVRSFFADNLAVRQQVNGPRVDSDFDGLTDDVEFEAQTDARNPDTDGDGYSDAFEWLRRGFGFDGRDGCSPPIVDVGLTATGACDPLAPRNCEYATFGGPRIYVDSDQDGLHDCEERALGTQIDSSDTDHDGISDLTEFVYQTDPLLWDYERDDDQDGVANGRELEWHLNPLVQQNEAASRNRYRYDRPETSQTIDGRPCYDFAVKGIKLGATLGTNEENPLVVGRNDIRLYIVENMADNLAGEPLVRTACIRTEYVKGVRKVPAGGEVTLVEADFHYLYSQDPIFQDPAIVTFDPSLHCLNPQ